MPSRLKRKVQTKRATVAKAAHSRAAAKNQKSQKKTSVVVTRKPKKGKKPMAKEDDERRRREEEKKKADAARAKQSQHQDKTQHENELEAKKLAKEAEKGSIYGETPKPGSLDPGKSTMANPGPQNVPIPPIKPTDDPMATPPAGPLPNPPSRPGGDFAGEPNVSPTGEKLSPDHPDYRKDYEGQHAPDHRTAEEKKAEPRE